MAMIKLAEALLRRKELDGKVKGTAQFKASNVFDLQVKGVKVTDNIDEVTANVPMLSLHEVTAEHDHYARSLRQVDAAIQQANWTVQVEVPDLALKDASEVIGSVNGKKK